VNFDEVEMWMDRGTAMQFTDDFAWIAVKSIRRQPNNVWLRAWAAALARDAVGSMRDHVNDPKTLAQLQYELGYGLAFGAAQAMGKVDFQLLDKITQEILEDIPDKVH
jgi:hypothetical protein